jgi:hypothetical protein
VVCARRDDAVRGRDARDPAAQRSLDETLAAFTAPEATRRATPSLRHRRPT